MDLSNRLEGNSKCFLVIHWVRIWVCAMISQLKKPLGICQTGWKEIQNTSLVIHWVRIWVCAMISLLKKPLWICQTGWKEIQNAFLVIYWVRIWVCAIITLLKKPLWICQTRWIQDITWLRGDTNFIFECWKYLSRVSEANEWEILSAREDKIRITKPPCNVLFIL